MWNTPKDRLAEIGKFPGVKPFFVLPGSLITRCIDLPSEWERLCSRERHCIEKPNQETFCWISSRPESFRPRPSQSYVHLRVSFSVPGNRLLHPFYFHWIWPPNLKHRKFLKVSPTIRNLLPPEKRRKVGKGATLLFPYSLC